MIRIYLDCLREVAILSPPTKSADFYRQVMYDHGIPLDSALQNVVDLEQQSRNAWRYRKRLILFIIPYLDVYKHTSLPRRVSPITNLNIQCVVNNHWWDLLLWIFNHFLPLFEFYVHLISVITDTFFLVFFPLKLYFNGSKMFHLHHNVNVSLT